MPSIVDREVGDDRRDDERGDGDEPEGAVLEQRVDDDEQQADEAGEQADPQLLLAELGLMSSCVCSEKDIGRAPNFSCSASSLAPSRW